MRKNATKLAAAVLSLAMVMTSVNMPASAAKTKVKLNKTKATLYVNGSASEKATTLKVTVNGKKVNATFKSSNTKVLTVAKKTGKVTAKKNGTAKVTATYKKKKYNCTVTVKTYATSVSITSAKTLNLAAGKTATINATVKPSTASNKKVSFASSDKNVATVTSAGKVTAKKAGTATVTVKALGSKKAAKKATVKVNVKAAAKPTTEPTTEPTTTPTTAPTATPETPVATEGAITVTTNVSGATIKVVSGSAVAAEANTGDGTTTTTKKIANGTYTVIVSKDGYEDAKAIATINGEDVSVSVELKAVPVTSVSVNAINADQFEVKFNNTVDKKLAESLSNYEIKDETVTSVLTDASAKAELQEDGKTVIITRIQKYDPASFNQKTLSVKIQNIKTTDGKAVPTYEGKVNVFDNVAPTVTKINQVSPTEFDIVFSEPVTAQDFTALNSALRINNGAYSFTAKTRVDNSKLATNVIRVTTNATLAEGKYTLTVKEGLVDYAGFKVATGDHEFTVTKDTSAITASVSKVTKNKVYVEFNKVVKNFDDSNVKFNLDYATNDAFKASSVTADPDNEKGIIVTFAQPVTPQSHSLILAYVDSTKKMIEDNYANKLAAQTLSFSVLADNVAPTAKAEYNKDTKKVEVTFSETVQGAKAIDAYELVDANGNKVNISEVTVKTNTNELVYELTPSKALEGTYTVKILANKIKDDSFEENKLAAVSLNIGVADSTAPTVGTITYGGKDNNKIFIPYSEAMKTSGEGSILDKTLYVVNDKKLTQIEGASLTLGNDNKSVIITLPTVNSAVGSKISIGRVADVSGNYTGFSAATDKAAVNDGAIAVLAGVASGSTGLSTSVIGTGKNVQILDHKTAVFYLDRTVTAVDASKITANSVAANSAVYTNVNVKLADGTYTTVAKVTATFADNTFKTNATLASSGSLSIAASAFVTSLGTTSAAPAAFTADLEDKAAPVIAKAVTDLNGDGKSDNDDDVIATGADGYVDTITVKLSEDMKEISAEGSAAAALVSVDGYKVKKVEIANAAKSTLTITVEPIDKETASQTPKITLGKLEDAAGNVLTATTQAFDNTVANATATLLSQSDDTTNFTALVRVDFTEAMNADDIKTSSKYTVGTSTTVEVSSVGSNNKYVILKVTGVVANKLSTSGSATTVKIDKSVKDANKVVLSTSTDLTVTLANPA